LLLNKPESPYLAYLQAKTTELIPYLMTEQSLCYDEIREKIQREMMADKYLVDRSQEAFVSYLRYYKEHQLAFIFAFTLLDIGQVANSFFLFRLPRVKEILGRKVDGFKTRHDVDINNIAYKDKN
jgi:ATP-dependent RNA helicase DDX55/SPB4